MLLALHRLTVHTRGTIQEPALVAVASLTFPGFRVSPLPMATPAPVRAHRPRRDRLTFTYMPDMLTGSSAGTPEGQQRRTQAYSTRELHSLYVRRWDG